ncbi:MULTISPECIES: hypothetical protein [Pseudomonas]|uniref:hypothetical protein n=1 Tax=Pseudomonas TaxID=286 RepID=UPI00026FEB83|nr:MULTISPECIES: hypothetical protein [Pseudomonas]EJM28317.1 hypothetical protein PMI24_02507 [Pseudomonas sp. GM25]MCU0090913.1 hypothetical protein [Pseudomonas koreensis]
MDNVSQVSNEKASSEPLPKGMIRGFLDGSDFALPGLRMIVGPLNNLVFAELVGGNFKNKIAMSVKEEHLGKEIDVPNDAHCEIMVAGVLHLDVKGIVKLESVAGFPWNKFKGTVAFEFDGGKSKFTSGVFDLSDE